MDVPYQLVPMVPRLVAPVHMNQSPNKPKFNSSHCTYAYKLILWGSYVHPRPVAPMHMNQYPMPNQPCALMQPYANMPIRTPTTCHVTTLASCPDPPLPLVFHTIPTFCTCSHPTFPRLFPLCFVLCLFWGGTNPLAYVTLFLWKEFCMYNVLGIKCNVQHVQKHIKGMYNVLETPYPSLLILYAITWTMFILFAFIGLSSYPPC